MSTQTARTVQMNRCMYTPSASLTIASVGLRELRKKQQLSKSEGLDFNCKWMRALPMRGMGDGAHGEPMRSTCSQIGTGRARQPDLHNLVKALMCFTKRRKQGANHCKLVARTLWAVRCVAKSMVGGSCLHSGRVEGPGETWRVPPTRHATDPRPLPIGQHCPHQQLKDCWAPQRKREEQCDE